MKTQNISLNLCYITVVQKYIQRFRWQESTRIILLQSESLLQRKKEPFFELG